MSPQPPQPTALASTLATDIRAISGKLKRRLREQGGGHNLTQSQASVLIHLEKDGPATVSSLARTEGMRPQSMSAIALALEQAGLIRGSADPNDGRQTILSLTPKCVRWIEKSRTAKQDWLTTTIAQKLSPTEQQKLQAAINLLQRIVAEE